MAKKKAASKYDELSEFLRWSRRYSQILEIDDWDNEVLLYRSAADQRELMRDLIKFMDLAAPLLAHWEPKIIEKQPNSIEVAAFDMVGQGHDSGFAPSTFAATAHGACVKLMFDNAAFSFGEITSKLSLDIDEIQNWSLDSLQKSFSFLILRGWIRSQRHRLSASLARERMLVSGVADPLPANYQAAFTRIEIQAMLNIQGTSKARSEKLRRYFRGANIQSPKGPVSRMDLFRLLEYLANDSDSSGKSRESREAAKNCLTELRG